MNWLFLDQRPLGAILGQQVREVQTFKDKSGTPQYYVVYLNPTGFVIVSGDDLIEPIIGFVCQGFYDPSPANPLGELVSQDMSGRMAEATELPGAAQAQGQAFTPTGRQQAALQKWEFLQGSLAAGSADGNSSLPVVSDVRVAPLVTTKWSQEKDNADSAPCYNYYTTWNAKYYPCGCVATAMAQLMRFWSWPKGVVGTKAFEISVDGVKQEESLRGGTGTGGPYAWSKMIDDPKADATTAQRQAIGNLTHDAGVAINMEYTSSASGSAADSADAAKALVNTFGYSNVKLGKNAWNIPLPNLYNMINPNLDAAMPVILGTTDHDIICDGYGYNAYALYHHLNLGWGGTADAWYNLPTIDISGQSAYQTLVECLYNVYTSGSGEIISGRVVDAKNNPLSGALVTATISGSGTRTTTSNGKGIYAFTKLPSAATCAITASMKGYVSFNAQKVTTGTSTDNDIVCGNLWGIDLSGTKAKPRAAIFGLLLN